jgi:hypothetical protein
MINFSQVQDPTNFDVVIPSTDEATRQLVRTFEQQFAFGGAIDLMALFKVLGSVSPDQTQLYIRVCRELRAERRLLAIKN